MSKQILIKPVISEKSGKLSSGKLNQYVFVVERRANKVEIAKAVKEMFNVEALAVNTMVMPAKNRTRMTRAGMIRGSVSSFKKAVVTLAEGDSINLYGAEE